MSLANCRVIKITTQTIVLTFLTMLLPASLEVKSWTTAQIVVRNEHLYFCIVRDNPQTNEVISGKQDISSLNNSVRVERLLGCLLTRIFWNKKMRENTQNAVEWISWLCAHCKLVPGATASHLKHNSQMMNKQYGCQFLLAFFEGTADACCKGFVNADRWGCEVINTKHILQ